MAIAEEIEPAAPPKTARSGMFTAHAMITMMLCVLFAIMYLDRVNISAAAASLKTEFHLTNTQMGSIFSAFSWAYLASVVFGGWGARKYGARITLFVCVIIVGLGTVFTGLVSGLVSLVLARFAVGLGEGPAFPAATQAMRNWFPAQRFGFIQGITHSASRLGAAIAPPLVAAIIIWWNWRVSFIVCGIAAIVWAAAWLFYFEDDPRAHPQVDNRHLEGLSVSLPDRKARFPHWILTKRMFPVTIVMFSYGWTYWVFVSWLPLYFANQHGTNLKDSALLTSALFCAGLVGNTAGGVASDLILTRTGRGRLARCSVVLTSLIGAAVFLIPCLFVEHLVAIVALLAAAMFCLELTIAPMYAISMDISKEYAGMGSAYIIMGVAISGIISPVVFGWLIDLTGNWNIPFASAILILLMGAMVVGVLRPDIPLEVPASPE